MGVALALVSFSGTVIRSPELYVVQCSVGNPPSVEYSTGRRRERPGFVLGAAHGPQALLQDAVSLRFRANRNSGPDEIEALVRGTSCTIVKARGIQQASKIV